MYTYYAPAVFEVTDELFSEIQAILIGLDPLSPCRIFFSTLTCTLRFPACNGTTGKILPVCPEQCPTIDAIEMECSVEYFRNNSDFPAVNQLLDTTACLEPQMYYNLPAQYIATDPNDCIRFSKCIIDDC